MSPYRRKLYQSLFDAKARCYKKSNNRYKNYGARGITVCKRWLDDFENFYDDMIDGYKPGLSLDRIDNNRGYSPENCRWASKHTQQRNRTDNHYIQYKGQNKVISDWSDELGIKRTTLIMRITQYGWSIHDAFTIPVGSLNSRRNKF